jgi:GlcNAc-P-P-Und epimerase
MKSVLIFGGSGFVGTHLIRMLKEGNCAQDIYIADIKKPKQEQGAVFVFCDIRKPVSRNLCAQTPEVIINLAAIHTSPGHEPHEYFNANILGARHITAYAQENSIKKLIFTSSISVYGPGEDEKNEECVQMPNIPYGSSKAIAEYIHREWFLNSGDKLLCILRPGVIFGKGEGGNFTRMANAQEKGYFIYPGRKDTIKACLYVKDICRFIISMTEQNSGFSLYNFCYPEKITTSMIAQAFHDAMGYSMPFLVMPLWLINAGAAVLGILNLPVIKKLGLVPDRIVKLVRSTNISSQKLVNSGFTFKYPLTEALADWGRDCGGKHLF